MKWLQLSKDTVLFGIILFLLGYIIVSNGLRKINDNSPVEGTIDTTYNYITIDSIKYNIIEKDSIIHKLKYKYEIEVIKVSNLDDSSSVELFKDLCTGYSLYGQSR